jgi:hypothetical protein
MARRRVYETKPKGEFARETPLSLDTPTYFVLRPRYRQ